MFKSGQIVKCLDTNMVYRVVKYTYVKPGTKFKGPKFRGYMQTGQRIVAEEPKKTSWTLYGYKDGSVKEFFETNVKPSKYKKLTISEAVFNELLDQYVEDGGEKKRSRGFGSFSERHIVSSSGSSGTGGIRWTSTTSGS